MERLSNGMSEIPEVNYWDGIETGYDPLLMFYNGVNFPTRTNYYMMHLNSDNSRYLDHFYALERRIFDAIDSGYFLRPNGEKFPIDSPESFEYLGNVIQRNKDSMGNFYFYGMLETFGRKLLSGSFDSVFSYTRIPR
jgi:Hemocyanin, copper containing domain